MRYVLNVAAGVHTSTNNSVLLEVEGTRPATSLGLGCCCTSVEVGVLRQCGVLLHALSVTLSARPKNAHKKRPELT